LSDSLKEAAHRDHPPVEVMLLMISGYWLSRVIYAAARLGLPDLLKDGPKSVNALAEQTSTVPSALYRLLRALASFGIFHEDEDGDFHTTPLASVLESDRAFSLHSFAVSVLGEDHYQAWGELIHSLETGRPGFELALGVDVWRYYSTHPEAGRLFSESMADLTGLIAPGILASYDFSSASTVVDIGGGQGELLSCILAAHPGVKGILCDLAHATEGARSRLAGLQLLSRCDILSGDFFEEVPGGGDIYLMKFVIHDWNDESAVKILTTCRKAMKPGAKLLLIESVVPGRNEFGLSKLVDLNMMVVTGGRERTLEEYRGLLEQAGLVFGRAIETEAGISIIEAGKM
jgi:hypothetical protein